MVKIFGINLFECFVCNGRKHKMTRKGHSHAHMRSYKGGYVYKGDKYAAGKDVTHSSVSNNSNGKGKGLSRRRKHSRRQKH
jgi:hypothetical protein